MHSKVRAGYKSVMEVQGGSKDLETQAFRQKELCALLCFMGEESGP